MQRTGDERAPGVLLRIALTHHLAFDFERAGAAYDEAFELPAPEPARLETTERMTSAKGISRRSRAWVRLQRADLGARPKLYRGLVSIGRDFEIVPDVAERLQSPRTA